MATASGSTLSVQMAAAPAKAGQPQSGYDPRFLRKAVPLPKLLSSKAKDAVKLNGSPVLDYTHFSLTMSTSRRFCHWVAWNIDGAQIKKVSRTNLSFVVDRRIPLNAQVGNELYADNRIDRGHLARRADVVWGTLEEAARANKDSFFYTNITPQMEDFNQSGQRGLWGRLEDAIFDDVDVDDLRVSVFGGPVFKQEDRVYRDVQIPRDYWKVLTYCIGRELRAKGFVLTQNLSQLEALDLDEFRVYQVTLDEIEDRTAVRFPSALKKADAYGAKLAESFATGIERRPLCSLSDITW